MGFGLLWGWCNMDFGGLLWFFWVWGGIVLDAVGLDIVEWLVLVWGADL